VARGSIDSLIRKITIRRKNSQAQYKSNSSSSIISNSKGKRFIVVGIVIAVIGFAGAVFYGSQFVKEEVNAGGTLPYTIPTHIKSVLPIDLEIVFVIIGVIGFGIFTYGFATRVDKPLDFYPT
jgi:multisubunit Na+/H+ antiporter MnhB subunit